MSSWIRDWRSSDPDEPAHILCVRNDALGQRIYRAAGDELLEATISEASNSLPPSDRSIDSYQVRRRRANVPRRLGSLSRELPDKSVYSDPQCTCWRTLVADIFDHEKHFEDLPTESWTSQSTLLVYLEYIEMKIYNWIMQILRFESVKNQVLWKGMRHLAHTAKEATGPQTRRKKGFRGVFNHTFEKSAGEDDIKQTFCVTENGYFGLVPKQAHGARNDGWQLIGESYVHGMMDGEALNGLKEGYLSSEKFILIWQFAKLLRNSTKQQRSTQENNAPEKTPGPDKAPSSFAKLPVDYTRFWYAGQHCACIPVSMLVG
ncbi:hypothetical protein BDZ45DRAFT_745897 [Acephala macrosclerotiorum]|nr:hypothetical protein BDZ45DRAFT_745897 [Acephala macrosclerotiorum]